MSNGNGDGNNTAALILGGTAVALVVLYIQGRQRDTGDDDDNTGTDPTEDHPNAKLFVEMHPEAGQITFDAHDSDPGPNGNELTGYKWTITTPNGDSFTKTGVDGLFDVQTEGVYDIKLVVTNDLGLNDSDSTTVEYQEPSGGDEPVIEPPIANFSHDVSEDTLSVDASASEPGDNETSIVEYQWTLISPSGGESFASGVSTTFALSEEGTHEIELLVVDSEGNADTEVSTFEYEKTNVIPVEDDTFIRIGYGQDGWMCYAIQTDSIPGAIHDGSRFEAWNYRIDQMEGGTYLIRGATGTEDPDGPMFGDSYEIVAPEDGHGILGLSVNYPSGTLDDVLIEVNGKVVQPGHFDPVPSDLTQFQIVDQEGDWDRC